MPVEQDQVGTLVETGEHGERGIQFLGETKRIRVALGGKTRQFDETQGLRRQCVADAGDDAGSAAVDDAVDHLRVDAHHEVEIIPLTGDVLGCVAERFPAAELLEAHQVMELGGQVEEQARAGLEAVIGTVVDDCGQLTPCTQNSPEVRMLGSGRRRPGQDTRDDHEADRTGVPGVISKGHGTGCVLRTGTHDDGNAGGD